MWSHKSCARRSKPWLRGKEAEVHELETAVHRCEEELRKAWVRDDPNLGDLLGKRRQASQALRSAKRRWEACLWDDLAAKANQAGEGGNDFLFWQVCRQLGFRDAEPSAAGMDAGARSQAQSRIEKLGRLSCMTFRRTVGLFPNKSGNLCHRSTPCLRKCRNRLLAKSLTMH